MYELFHNQNLNGNNLSILMIIPLGNRISIIFYIPENAFLPVHDQLFSISCKIGINLQKRIAVVLLFNNSGDITIDE